MIKFTCKKCQQPAGCEFDGENEGTNLCYHCFEDGMEEYEEKRRERIARQNEY